MRMLDLSPAELGIKDINMKGSPAAHSSGTLNLEGYSQVTVLFTIVNVGAATDGGATLTLQRYDKDDTAVGEELDLATAIALTHDDSTLEVAVTLVADGLATAATNGTISTDAKHVFPLGRCKLIMNITTSCDAVTSSTGNVRLYAK